MKPDNLFDTQQEFKDDELLEYLKFSPSKSAEHINEDIYYAVNQELVNE